MPDMHGQTLSEEWSASEKVIRIKDIFSQADCPEFGGDNTKVRGEQEHMLQPRTRVVYLPMINKLPAEPATMTAIMPGEE